jgi:hypothetical protein
MPDHIRSLRADHRVLNALDEIHTIQTRLLKACAVPIIAFETTTRASVSVQWKDARARRLYIEAESLEKHFISQIHLERG